MNSLRVLTGISSVVLSVSLLLSYYYFNIVTSYLYNYKSLYSIFFVVTTCYQLISTYVQVMNIWIHEKTDSVSSVRYCEYLFNFVAGEDFHLEQVQNEEFLPATKAKEKAS